MRKKDLISPELFVKIMITAGEINLVLKQIEGSVSNEQIIKNYLDIYQKFQGLIGSKGKAHILSTSLISELHNNKINQKYLALAKEHNLTSKQQEFFLEVVKLDKFIINEADKPKWHKFCLECCKKNKGLVLGNMVKDLAKLGLHEYWVNTSFLEEYEKKPQAALVNLNQAFEDGRTQRQELVESGKIIEQMENQIAKWKDPKLFIGLYKDLQENLKKIDNLLSIDENNLLNAQLALQQLNKLVDVIDLSIKAVQNSAEYEDKKQQVENFKAMLGEFFDLMKKWKVDDKNVERLDDRIESIEDFFKSTQNDAKELLTSRNFSAIGASLYQPAALGFSRGFNLVDNKTLADFHTLVHQSLLSSVGRRSKEITKLLESKIPEFVRSMEKHLISKQTYLEFENSRRAGAPELIWSNLQSPNLDLHYNIPLNNHSGYLDIKYNYQRKTAKLSFQLFGREPERWREITEFGSILIASETDALITKAVSNSNFMTIEVEINENTKNVKELVEILSTLGLATLDDNLILKREFDPRGLYYEKLESSNALMKVIKDSRDVKGNVDYKTIIAIIASYKEISQEVIDKLNLEKNRHLLRNGYVNIQDILHAQNEDELYKIAIPNIIIEQHILIEQQNNYAYTRQVTYLWKHIKSIPDIGNQQILLNSINKILKTDLQTSDFIESNNIESNKKLSLAIRAKYHNDNGVLQLIAAMAIDDSVNTNNYLKIFENSHKLKAYISNLDYNKSKYLASDDAVACYKNKYIELIELKDFDIDKITALTSPEAQACYVDHRYTTLVKFDHIKGLDTAKIKALTSPEALACYMGSLRNSYIKFNDLAQLTLTDIYKYTNACYYPYYEARLTLANVMELNKLESEDFAKYKVLTSPEALACYKGNGYANYIHFDDLKQLTSEEISKFTKAEYHQYYALKFTLENVRELDKLRSTDPAKYQALISPEVLDFYKNARDKDKYFNFNILIFNILKHFDTDKIKALTSPGAFACYKDERYKNSNIGFDTLKHFDTAKIKALTSPEILACLQSYDYYNDIKLNELQTFDADKITALTSPEAFTCYKRIGYAVDRCIKFDQLKAYAANKIKVLTSLDAIACYQSGCGIEFFDELQGFDADKIKALTSPEALSYYQKTNANFYSLKKLDVNEIKNCINIYHLYESASEENNKSTIIQNLIKECNAAIKNKNNFNLDDIASNLTTNISSYLSADDAQKTIINAAIKKELETNSKELLQNLNNFGSWQKSVDNNIAWRILYNIIDAIGQLFGKDSKEARLIKPIQAEITKMISNLGRPDYQIGRNQEGNYSK